MGRQGYTADSICRELGLSAFVESSWGQSELRVCRIVLSPAFHAELVVTLTESPPSLTLSVAAAEESIRGGLHSGPAAVHREECSLPANRLHEIVEAFRFAQANVAQESHLYLDGMGAECCLISRHEQRRFKHNALRSTVRCLVASVLELAWRTCRTVKVKNRLAEVAKYAGLDYPLEEEPPAAVVTKLLVLGEAAERAEYLHWIRSQSRST
jgi:hypothetical protein